MRFGSETACNKEEITSQFQKLSIDLLFCYKVHVSKDDISDFDFEKTKIQRRVDPNPSCRRCLFSCRSVCNLKNDTSAYWFAPVSWILCPFQIIVVSGPYVSVHRHLECFCLVLSDSFSNYAYLFRKWPKQNLLYCHNTRRNNRKK